MRNYLRNYIWNPSPHTHTVWWCSSDASQTTKPTKLNVDYLRLWCCNYVCSNILCVQRTFPHLMCLVGLCQKIFYCSCRPGRAIFVHKIYLFHHMPSTYRTISSIRWLWLECTQQLNIIYQRLLLEPQMVFVQFHTHTHTDT